MITSLRTSQGVAQHKLSSGMVHKEWIHRHLLVHSILWSKCQLPLSPTSHRATEGYVPTPQASLYRSPFCHKVSSTQQSPRRIPCPWTSWHQSRLGRTVGRTRLGTWKCPDRWNKTRRCLWWFLVFYMSQNLLFSIRLSRKMFNICPKLTFWYFSIFLMLINYLDTNIT